MAAACEPATINGIGDFRHDGFRLGAPVQAQRGRRHTTAPPTQPFSSHDFIPSFTQPVPAGFSADCIGQVTVFLPRSERRCHRRHFRLDKDLSPISSRKELAMKALPLLLAVGSLAIGTAQAGTVVLTPDDVVNGIQINAAIDEATEHGTEPGKVVFDGQHKGFSCFVGEDNPDNSKLTFIQYSNLQLVGINGADTGDGICNIVFADAPLENILIQGLKVANFIEEGTGISAPGLSPRKNVTIRDNDITGAIALQAFNPVRWKIYSNTIGRARDEVMVLIGAQDSEIIGNTITGFPGLLLVPSQTQETTGNKIIANRFSDRQGIELRGAATRNIVALNTGECPVVILGPATTQNKVLFNRAPSATCGSDGAVSDFGSGNRVVGNRP